MRAGPRSSQRRGRLPLTLSRFASPPAQVGPKGHVIGAVSGGVDSTVAAVLMNRAIGERFHAILVDNGCLRLDESKKVLKRLREDCGINLNCVDASELFLGKLKGVTEPEVSQS